MSKYMLFLGESGNNLSYTLYKFKNNIYERILWRTSLSTLNNHELVNSVNNIVLTPVHNLLKTKYGMTGFILIRNAFTHYFITDELGDFLEAMYIFINSINKRLGKTGNSGLREGYMLEIMKALEKFNYIRKIQERKLKELTEEILTYVTLEHI